MSYYDRYKKGQVRYERPRFGDVPAFYLPHQCDEWVIGGEKEARQLLADLTRLLAKHLPTVEEQV